MAKRSMRKAIVKAHNDGNKKAINKKIIDSVGITEVTFDAFKASVEECRHAVRDYVTAKFGMTETTDAVNALRDRIFPKWEVIMEYIPEAEGIVPVEYDVDSLVGMGETYFPTPKGSVWGVNSPEIFRKYVETYCGCKVAKNEVLGDDGRETLTAYQGAVRTWNNCNEKLYGKMDNDGNVDGSGILSQIDAVEHEVSCIRGDIATLKGLIKSTNGDVLSFLSSQLEDKGDALEKMEKNLELLRTEQGKIEKRMEEASEIMDTHKQAYGQLMASIKEIQ